MTTETTKNSKGNGCLGCFLILFFIAFFGVAGLIVWNFINVGSVAHNALSTICSGNVSQAVITFRSKYTGEKGELLATTSDGSFAQIVGHPCGLKPDVEVLKEIYLDATATYGNIRENQASYVEFHAETIYGQRVLLVSAVKPLTNEQAEKLNVALKNGKLAPEQVAEIIK